MTAGHVLKGATPFGVFQYLCWHKNLLTFLPVFFDIHFAVKKFLLKDERAPEAVQIESIEKYEIILRTVVGRYFSRARSL